MVIGEGAIGEFALGETAADHAIEAIKVSDLLPDDAFRAVKKFIKESFKETWNTLEELIDIQPPTEILEYWDTVVEILKLII